MKEGTRRSREGSGPDKKQGELGEGGRGPSYRAPEQWFLDDLVVLFTTVEIGPVNSIKITGRVVLFSSGTVGTLDTILSKYAQP